MCTLYNLVFNSFSFQFHRRGGEKKSTKPPMKLSPFFSPTRISTSSRHITSFCAITLASLASSKGRPWHRRTARCAAVAQPVFCSALSTQREWRAALAELVAEATYQCLRWKVGYRNCLFEGRKASWILFLGGPFPKFLWYAMWKNWVLRGFECIDAAGQLVFCDGLGALKYTHRLERRFLKNHSVW